MVDAESRLGSSGVGDDLSRLSLSSSVDGSSKLGSSSVVDDLSRLDSSRVDDGMLWVGVAKGDEDIGEGSGMNWVFKAKSGRGASNVMNSSSY